MKRIVSERVIQLIGSISAIFATGALWYFLSKGDYIAASLSAACAVALGWVAFYLQGLNDRSALLRTQREQLGRFLAEAEGLLARANEDPAPVEEHNSWVSRVEAYVTDTLDSSYAVRFSNFTGMTFYLSNPNMGFKKSLQGRSTRLHEFIEELAQK